MQFDRFIKLVGLENYERISNLKVLVVGIGGVGGYVVEALARCGVGTLILIDPDKIDVTNINRQVIATNSTIGQYKTDAFEKRIHDINKDCNVIKICDFVKLEYLTNNEYDFIVDACDDINAKKMLIRYAIDNNISFISSMGTGKRLDPSKLEITTIDKTNYDPIARILRKFVKDEKIKNKIVVLCSREEPVKVQDNVIASCSFVPSTAGLLIASYIVKNTLKKDS